MRIQAGQGRHVRLCRHAEAGAGRQAGKLVNPVKDRADIRKVEVIEVIRVTWVHGLGTDESPIGWATEYWTKDGIFIGRDDPNKPKWVEGDPL